jgi:hypothetical protein
MRIYAGEVLKAPFTDRTKAPPITEKHFSPKEMSALRQAVQNARRAGRQHIKYGDYGKTGDTLSGSLTNELRRQATKPAASVEMTLGQARVGRDGVVHDRYDFAAPPGKSLRPKDFAYAASALRSVNPRALFNFLGNAVGLRRGQGRPVRIDTGLRIPEGQRQYLRPKLAELPKQKYRQVPTPPPDAGFDAWDKMTYKNGKAVYWVKDD